MVVNVSENRVSGWKRFFMWDFPRGSVAYDIKVGAILAFIFLTPAHFFRDQPTLGKAKQDIVMLPRSSDGERYWLEGGLVDAIPPNQRVERVASIISDRTGRTKRVLKIDAMQSAEGDVRGYVAIAEP